MSQTDSQAGMADLYRHRSDALATERGSGQTVLFSHGHMMDRTMFAPQIAGLSDDYHTVAFDHPARTDRWQASYGMDDLVENTRHLMDGLGVDSCVLAGMSMGGFMAQEFAAAHPDRVEGLVLIDTTSEALPEDEQAEYDEAFADLQEADTVPREFAEWLGGLLFGETTNEQRPDLVEQWVDRWSTYPGEAVHLEAQSWVHRESFTDRLSDVDVPALAVHGEEDAGIPPAAAQPMVDALDAEMVTVAEAGHTSPLEQPDAVTGAIREFLDDQFA
jgi:pimeloyl-ACP methyl ester carboxylesterase